MHRPEAGAPARSSTSLAHELEEEEEEEEEEEKDFFYIYDVIHRKKNGPLFTRERERERERERGRGSFASDAAYSRARLRARCCLARPCCARKHPCQVCMCVCVCVCVCGVCVIYPSTNREFTHRLMEFRSQQTLSLSPSLCLAQSLSISVCVSLSL